MTEYCFIFHKNNLLIKKNSQILTLKDLRDLDLNDKPTIEVGKNLFALDIPNEIEHPDCEFKSLRSLFDILPTEDYLKANRAFQIINFERTNIFCGHCGKPLIDKKNERAKACPECGHISYPKVAPAVIVLITRKNEMLLAQNAQRGSGFYSTLAGFVDAGENLEACIHREIYEEIGVQVKNLKYFGSQSWPFPNTMMIAFTAEYKSGEIRVDKNEISDAKWFTPETLPPVPPNFSIARQMINWFCEQNKR